MRIGIFGGTFNPPHLAHKRLAQEMMKTASLDKIIVIPTYTPPHKISHDLIDGEERTKLCELTFFESYFEISDIEQKRKGKSYTFDTVTYLKEIYPDDELFLIIGSDMLLTFHQWYNFKGILENSTICVATRENIISQEKLCEYAHNILKLDENKGEIIISGISAFECSSTHIREKLRNHEDVSGFLTEKALKYITEKGLYMDKIEEYKQLLKSRLKQERYIHSLNVADSAKHLAQRYGADCEKAYLAGLLHDITKNTSDEEQLQIMTEDGIILSQCELNNKKLWHAMSGAAYLRLKLNITDEEIIGAVRYHTTGKSNMTLLEKIVYIADYISAERDYDDVDVMRNLAEESLEKASLYALKYSIRKLAKHEKLLHVDSVNYYNELLINKIKEGNEENE